VLPQRAVLALVPLLAACGVADFPAERLAALVGDAPAPFLVKLRPFAPPASVNAIVVATAGSGVRLASPTVVPGFNESNAQLLPKQWATVRDGNRTPRKPTDFDGTVLTGPVEIQYEAEFAETLELALYAAKGATEGVANTYSYLPVMPERLDQPLDVCFVDANDQPLSVAAEAPSPRPGCLRFASYAHAVDTTITFGRQPPLVIGASGEPTFVVSPSTVNPPPSAEVVRELEDAQRQAGPLWRTLNTRWGHLDCENHYVTHIYFSRRFRGFGGLEHNCSSSIGLGIAGQWKKGELSAGLLAILVHEMVHAWNVKRVYPIELASLDYRRFEAKQLAQLYFYEGFSDAFALPLLLEHDRAAHPNAANTQRRYADAFARLAMDAGKSGVELRTRSAYDFGTVVGLWLAARARQVHGLEEGKRRFYGIIPALVRAGGFDLLRPDWRQRQFNGTHMSPAPGAARGYTNAELIAVLARTLALPDWKDIETRFFGTGVPFATAADVEALARETANITGVPVKFRFYLPNTTEKARAAEFDLAHAPASAWPL
jgi:hypothetical protein